MTGSGTTGDPYIIYNATDLQNVELDATAHYELANNIDASDTITWNAGAGFISLGHAAGTFEGTLDGKGYKITDFYQSREYGGLFEDIWRTAEVSNVGMEDLTIVANFAGGIAYTNRGTITDCWTSGSLSGYWDGTETWGYLGGLVCDSAANLGVISGCYSTCTINGGEWGYCGGFASINHGTITQCKCSGAVTGGSAWGYCGGFVRDNDGTISECHATGNVVDGVWGYSGGFVYVNDGTCENCYARGSVKGVDEVGGFVGDNSYGTCTNCYSTGAVTGGSAGVGGFAGVGADADAVNCFWDTETSEQATSHGGTGKTTLEMKKKVTFTDVSWDFTTIWRISKGARRHPIHPTEPRLGAVGVINNGYPYLVNVTP